MKGRGVRVEFEITPSPGFLLHLSVEQELHCTDTCSCILNLYSLIKNYCILCQLSNNLLQSAMTSCGSVELLSKGLYLFWLSFFEGLFK